MFLQLDYFDAPKSGMAACYRDSTVQIFQLPEKSVIFKTVVKDRTFHHTNIGLKGRTKREVNYTYHTLQYVDIDY